jgi:hypothetical protein
MASSTYEAAAPDAPRQRSLGEHVFIWIAWALAAVFWGATMTAFVGILRAVLQPSGAPGGGAADAGGIAWLLIDVVGGLILLGLGLAYGSAMVARRNRRLDPVTEAATAALYDQIEAQGGEDGLDHAADSQRRRDDFH